MIVNRGTEGDDYNALVGVWQSTNCQCKRERF